MGKQSNKDNKKKSNNKKKTLLIFFQAEQNMQTFSVSHYKGLIPV